jgi:hypothetical protein
MNLPRAFQWRGGLHDKTATYSVDLKA